MEGKKALAEDKKLIYLSIESSGGIKKVELSVELFCKIHML